MAVDLRRRREHGIMEAMSEKSTCAMPKEGAGSEGDVNVHRVNSVAKGRGEIIQPFAQRAGSFRLASTEFINHSLEFD
jgi:hypothetical protein